jgi:DNA processing protein
MEDKLYLLGDKKCLEYPTACVVGSREMSEYGSRQTRRFTRGLVEAGYCIVSGMARGVDRVAHESAIESGGRTIAVLAHGIDQCYPPEHEELKKRIVDSGGLLVTQYEEGVGAERDHFRARNYAMVQLSQLVLVMESERRSGTKITVRHAAELGKTVYVVPGPVDHASYHGSVEIIRDGGIPVYSPQDLLEMIKSGI